MVETRTNPTEQAVSKAPEEQGVDLRSVLEENTDMYRLPGDPPLTKKDLERYVTTNESVEAKLQDLPAYVPNEWTNPTDEEIAKSRNTAPAQKQPEKHSVEFTQLIEEKLKNLDPVERAMAFREIKKVPTQDRARLIRVGLEDKDRRVRLWAYRQIKLLPPEERLAMVKELTTNPHPGTRIRAIEQVSLFSKQERFEIINGAVGDPIEQVRVAALRQFGSIDVSDNKWFEMIDNALSDPSEKVRAEALRQFRAVPVSEQERLSVIRDALDDTSGEIRKLAIAQFDSVPEDDRKALFEKAMESEEDDEILATVKQIKHAPKSIQFRLVEWGMSRKKGKMIEKDLTPTEKEFMDPEDQIIDMAADIRKASLEATENLEGPDSIRFFEQAVVDKNVNVRRLCFQLLKNIPSKHRVGIVEKGLQNENHHTRCTALQNLELIPEKQHLAILEQSIDDPHSDVRSEAARQLVLLPPKERDRLTQVFFDKHGDEIREFAGKTPLYRDAGERFLHKKFAKTGSGTTLLDVVPGQKDNSLRDRVMIRHIQWPSYSTWKQAYEAVETWKQLDFEYVPIEPIVSIKSSTDTGGADVVSRIIAGPAAREWGEKYPFYQAEIRDQITRIKQGLKQIEVFHGHEHEGNFIVYFNRNEEGEVDITTPPRVYLIDFDQARSPSTKTVPLG